MAFAILETKGAVAVLTVNNPKALNALSPAVLTDIDCNGTYEQRRCLRIQQDGQRLVRED